MITNAAEVENENSCNGKNIVSIETKRTIQGDSRVIMSPTELKMQPAIHLERKAGFGRGKYPALPSKCIVGCIFISVELIITRDSPCTCM
jgi:hypothetical protein